MRSCILEDRTARVRLRLPSPNCFKKSIIFVQAKQRQQSAVCSFVTANCDDASDRPAPLRKPCRAVLCCAKLAQDVICCCCCCRLPWLLNALLSSTAGQSAARLPTMAMPILAARYLSSSSLFLITPPRHPPHSAGSCLKLLDFQHHLINLVDDPAFLTHTNDNARNLDVYKALYHQAMLT